MINIRKFSILVLISLVIMALSTSVAFAQDPANGKVVWEEQVWQCSRCHGAMGEGMWARPLSNSTLTAQEWITQVRTPRRFMPSFSEEQVSDQQIMDIHAYITSLPAPTGDFTRAEANLPADAPEGQQLIAQKNCIACHSETGPIQGFVERGEMPTAEAVIKQLRTPFQNMPSFSPDQVSDAEAAAIADFLASEFAAQAAPAALPQSGQAGPSNVPVVLLLAGGGLVLIGLVLRRFLARATL